MKILKTLLWTEMPYAFFNYRGKGFYFTKKNGTIRSRLDDKTLEVLWTLDLPNVNFSEHGFAFFDDFLIAQKCLVNIPSKQILNFSDIVPDFRWRCVIDNKYIILNSFDEKKQKIAYLFDLKEQKILWSNNKITLGLGLFTNGHLAFFDTALKDQETFDGIISFNYLTGETLWQRSFKELGISQLDKFVGDVGDVLVCAFDEYNLIGLDKTTGNELWRVSHKAKLSNGILNAPSQGIYLFYGWADEDETIEQVNLNLLEIDSQTGQIRYDDDIFKHPNHQAVEGLRANLFYGYPKFHSALQWGEVIYFLVPISGIGPLAQIMAFDTVQKRIIEVSEQFFTTFHHWFVAEGKLFITAKVGKNIDSEINTDPSYHERVYDTGRFDGTTFHHQYFVISKEEYLTIIDLEENA